MPIRYIKGKTMNNIAMITGASRGIGAATASLFARKGYDLVLCCKENEKLLTDMADTFTKVYGTRNLVYIGDVSDPAFVDSMFTGLTHLNLLINNAGISHVGLIQDMTDDEWNRIVGVNLSSVFYTSRRAVPLMLHSDTAAIINVSSVWGNVGASTEVAYSATKGGVNAFTKALARELAPSRIPVNAVACGMIDTDMNKCFSPEDIMAITDEIPQGRMGTPEDIAQMIYSVVNSPSYMTGQIITIDGGWT